MNLAACDDEFVHLKFLSWLRFLRLRWFLLPTAGGSLHVRDNLTEVAVLQVGLISDLIFPIPELLVYITAAFTLEPGDILLTGTPAGVGPLAAGDRVEVTIAGLGTLANSVEAD